MRPLRHCLIAYTCFVLGCPGNAAALCVGLKFAGVPTVVTFSSASGGYGVYDTEQYLQTVTFQVEGGATGITCEYFVALSTGQSGNFSRRQLSQSANMLNYNAYTDAGKTLFKAPPTAAQGEVITGSFPVVIALTQTNTHSFYWTIPPLQIVPAQRAYYMDKNLSLDLYAGTLLSSPQLIASSPITFQTHVDSSVDLSLVRSGSPFNINDTAQVLDFGTLASGEQREIDLVIRSNNGYSVSMQSLNKQLMVHAEAPAISDSIPYQIVLNGGGINLATGAPVQVISGTGTTPTTGIAFPIEFTIGNLSGAEAAGTYSDIISVTVTAN